MSDSNSNSVQVTKLLTSETINVTLNLDSIHFHFSEINSGQCSDETRMNLGENV